MKFWELQDAESYDPAALQRLENTFRLPLFTQVSSVDRGSVPIVFGFPLSIRVCNKFSAASHWAERRLTAGKTSLRGKKNLPVMTLSVRKKPAHTARRAETPQANSTCVSDFILGTTKCTVRNWCQAFLLVNWDLLQDASASPQQTALRTLGEDGGFCSI